MRSITHGSTRIGGALASVLLIPLLIFFVVLIVAVAAHILHARIEHNEQTWLLEQLTAVLRPSDYDNDPLSDRSFITAEALGKEPSTIYRARKQGAPVAVAITCVAPDGYRGPMTLLVGIAVDGRVLGVRVLAHQETPGLGDQFQARGTHWLAEFSDKTLQSPPPPRWTVRKDGGDFNQFTGATITPRAIIKEVERALKYFDTHRDEFFVQAHTQ